MSRSTSLSTHSASFSAHNTAMRTPLLAVTALLVCASPSTAQSCNVANPSFASTAPGWLALESTGMASRTAAGTLTQTFFTNTYQRVSILSHTGEERTALAFGSTLPDGGDALAALLGGLTLPLNQALIDHSQDPFERLETSAPSATVGQTDIRLAQPSRTQHVALRLDYIAATFGEAFPCLEVRLAAYDLNGSPVADTTEEFLPTDIVHDPMDWETPQTLWTPATYPRTDLAPSERSLGWRTVEVDLDLGAELDLADLRFEFQLQALHSRPCAPHATFSSVVLDDLRLRAVTSSDPACVYGPAGTNCEFQSAVQDPLLSFQSAEVYWEDLPFLDEAAADQPSSNDRERVDTVAPPGSDGNALFLCTEYWDVTLTQPVPPSPSAIPGDLNHDDRVNGADLGLLMAAWGSASAIADLNRDGQVNGADQGILLANWGGNQCP